MTDPAPPAVVLPALTFRQSPNHSDRHGAAVDLLVWHETAGAYAGAIATLCDPLSRASAHLVIREDGLAATQLVPLARKAWHAVAYNPRSVGVEHASTTPLGYASEHQLRVSARVFGWLCWHLNIPPRWARGGVGAGVCYHGELGALGGNHPQCGPTPDGWQLFLAALSREVERGDWKPRWAT